MDSHKEKGSEKSVKLEDREAEEREMQFARMLIPLPAEPDDSGIDSDELERAAAQPFFGRRQHSCLSSSSDEDGMEWYGMERPWRCGLTLKTLQEIMAKEMEENINEIHSREELHLDREMEENPNKIYRRAPLGQDRPLSSPAANSLDRASPPLYEVELTASDEDDASVMELVIPVPSSRYHRVPTSSPGKTNRVPKNQKTISNFCVALCCVRK